MGGKEGDSRQREGQGGSERVVNLQCSRHFLPWP